jgi:hypothetical protein
MIPSAMVQSTPEPSSARAYLLVTIEWASPSSVAVLTNWAIGLASTPGRNVPGMEHARPGQ